jgi:predicted small metal-binding protein
MSRYYVDCRSMPSESNCSLYISGERDHVIRAAAEHAASVHGHEDTQEFRDEIAQHLQEETQEVGVGAAA